MNELQIKGTKITELSFTNKLEKNVQLKIGNKYSYNVRYAPNNICVGEFTADISQDENADIFSIKLVYSAVFSYPSELGRDEIHRKSYDAIFPYVRAAVASITALAGIPPLHIPYIDISGEEIYQIKIPTKS